MFSSIYIYIYLDQSHCNISIKSEISYSKRVCIVKEMGLKKTTVSFVSYLEF